MLDPTRRAFLWPWISRPKRSSPGSARRIGIITGGSFDGERLSGSIMDGGSDWQTIKADGCVQLDVRLVLRTLSEQEVIVDTGKEAEGDPAGYRFRHAVLRDREPGR